MYYTEIEIAESMSTPTKISARNPVCRWCGGSHESRYMPRIFSKACLSKDLYSKVSKTCGIKISEDDTRSVVLCGVTFVELFCESMRSTFTVFASAVEASIKGYATRTLWWGWAAIKGGHTKMLVVPIISFFPLLGRLCLGRFYILTEQIWF